MESLQSLKWCHRKFFMAWKDIHDVLLRGEKTTLWQNKQYYYTHEKEIIFIKMLTKVKLTD